jgi:hypothetical protein
MKESNLYPKKSVPASHFGDTNCGNHGNRIRFIDPKKI